MLISLVLIAIFLPAGNLAFWHFDPEQPQWRRLLNFTSAESRRAKDLRFVCARRVRNEFLRSDFEPPSTYRIHPGIGKVRGSTDNFGDSPLNPALSLPTTQAFFTILYAR
jgi:hypothetical protein